MNLHPLIVHFPIALLFTAGGIYIYNIFKPNHPFAKAAELLHVIGVIGAIGGILSGMQAEGQTIHTQEIHEMIENHALLAYVVVWTFGLMLIWRYLRAKHLKAIEEIAFVVVFCVGLGIMTYMASIGGDIVYDKGAGVEPYKPTLKEIFQEEQQNR